MAQGQVDVAVVWGPLAGYFAAQEPEKLRVTPVEPTFDGPQWPMAFDISMGLRRGDPAFQHDIEQALQRNHAAIQAILAAYHVPLSSDPAEPVAGTPASTGSHP